MEIHSFGEFEIKSRDQALLNRFWEVVQRLHNPENKWAMIRSAHEASKKLLFEEWHAALVLSVVSEMLQGGQYCIPCVCNKALEMIGLEPVETLEEAVKEQVPAWQRLTKLPGVSQDVTDVFRETLKIISFLPKGANAMLEGFHTACEKEKSLEFVKYMNTLVERLPNDMTVEELDSEVVDMVQTVMRDLELG